MTIKGNSLVYVSSDRNREVVVIDISSGTSGRLVKRIKLDGNALGMTISSDGSSLFVAQDNADQVAEIDTSTNTVITEIDARAPLGVLGDDDDDDDDQDSSILPSDALSWFSAETSSFRPGLDGS